jgi:L-lactate dehydrogenase complex protein LldE
MAPTVHLFIPCFIDQLFPEAGIAAVNILKELGCNVVYPAEQTCCGQPAFNSGYWEETVPLAERFIEMFSGAEYVVAPSGSCASMVKNAYGDLPISESRRNTWGDWRNRVYEFSQFLGDVLKIETWEGYFPARVTYHDSCHGLRELGISQRPRELLKSIRGLEYVEMFRPDTCCGFGGTFSVKFGEIATAMVENKVSWIQESGAEYVVACDSSCLMHIEGYLKRQKIPVKTMHLAEVLWRAIRQGKGKGW